MGGARVKCVVVGGLIVQNRILKKCTNKPVKDFKWNQIGMSYNHLISFEIWLVTHTVTHTRLHPPSTHSHTHTPTLPPHTVTHTRIHTQRCIFNLCTVSFSCRIFTKLPLHVIQLLIFLVCELNSSCLLTPSNVLHVWPIFHWWEYCIAVLLFHFFCVLLFRSFLQWSAASVAIANSRLAILNTSEQAIATVLGVAEICVPPDFLFPEHISPATPLEVSIPPDELNAVICVSQQIGTLALT